MLTCTKTGAFFLQAAAILTVACLSRRAAAQTAPAPGSDAAAREAVLKELSVERLIGDAVSLSNQAYPEVEDAIRRFINGDLAGAREYLEVAKKKYPKLPPTDLTLAKMQVIVRNGAAARAFLEKVVTEQPNDPEAFLLLADLAFSEGRIAESHLLFEHADELTKKFAENEKRKNNFAIRVLAGLAAVHERRLKWAEANALLRQWVEIDPESAVAHQRLGQTLFRLNRHEDALAEFTTARKIDPASNHPQVWMGQLYMVEKNVAEARKAFEQAYAAEPDNEGTARAYVEWLIQQNDLAKARSVASALREKSPNSIPAILLDGVISKLLGQNDAAEEALTKVLTLDPNNSIATNMLALILSETKDAAKLERALGHAQRNAALFPNNTQINVTLAWVLFQQGRLQDAQRVLNSGIQNPNADAAYLIARMFYEQKQEERAAGLLQEILDQTAGGVFLYRREAEALFKQLADAGVTPRNASTPGANPPPGGSSAPTGGAAPGISTPTGRATPGATAPGVGQP
jgi:tetratricopeptide (TPR) repeat protein